MGGGVVNWGRGVVRGVPSLTKDCRQKSDKCDGSLQEGILCLGFAQILRKHAEWGVALGPLYILASRPALCAGKKSFIVQTTVGIRLDDPQSGIRMTLE